MSLEHEFYLISKTTVTKDFWVHREKNECIIDSVVIHDDIIQYISDSLKWIVSKNPALKGNPMGQGINYHGVTLFDKQSAESLRRVFSSWRDLFLNAPNPFELTGEFIYDEDNQEGGYEKVFLNREEVINLLEKIVSMARRLESGNFYLYHCGI
ncbi:hypothetical protein [Fictibacillus barbaricus]|uniref:Coproporphyrinogen III oxidase n=1 Tax=Fictibacillus barbaricus TaxID=182136 RepID=A0ABU1TWH9_9BACL|nr:hypothetical protein [Fictibacillus barbaricus]MDR7071565.1 hypothetical protein [Fictibacillus barbaricus]